MIQFEENARTEGRKDGQTLLHRTFPATAGGPKWLKKLLIFRLVLTRREKGIKIYKLSSHH